jgi:hypothetical protein
MLPPNVCFQLPADMVSYPCKMESSATPLQKSHNSHTLYFFSDTLNATKVLNWLTVHKIILYSLHILCMLQSILVKKNSDLKICINILQ